MSRSIRVMTLLLFLAAATLIAYRLGIVSSITVQAKTTQEVRAPIVILSDEDLTADNGVRSGSGVKDDPYIISDWRIDAVGIPFCIRIEGVSKAFRIENCYLTGASSLAVTISEVSDGSIGNSCVVDSLFGVQLTNCDQFEIRNCAFDAISWTALSLVESSGCTVEQCVFTEAALAIHFRESSLSNFVVDCVFLEGCGTAIRLEPQCGGNTIARNDFIGSRCFGRSYNLWRDLSGIGNYWSKYIGKDRNEDGIGDDAYRILSDTYEMDFAPRMSPLHPGTLEGWNPCLESE